MRVLEFVGGLAFAVVLGVGTYECIKFFLSRARSKGKSNE